LELREPGTVLLGKDSLNVATKDGYVALEEVQPAGKRRMSGVEFARGYRPSDGERFV